MIDLGTLEGKTDSVGLAINDLGQIVGYSLPGSSQFFDAHAFIYDGTGIVDLNDLIDSQEGWLLNIGQGINDRGQIVGEGTRDGFHIRAFLLTPIPTGAVPEPAAWVMMIAGFGLTGVAMRRHNEGAVKLA
jgi:probable HAF family extracellular repeat protein